MVLLFATSASAQTPNIEGTYKFISRQLPDGTSFGFSTAGARPAADLLYRPSTSLRKLANTLAAGTDEVLHHL